MIFGGPSDLDCPMILWLALLYFLGLAQIVSSLSEAQVSEEPEGSRALSLCCKFADFCCLTRSRTQWRTGLACYVAVMRLD